MSKNINKVDTKKVNITIGILASKDSSFEDKIKAQSSLNEMPIFINDKIDSLVKKAITLRTSKVSPNGFVNKLESSHKDTIVDFVSMLDEDALTRVNEIFSLLNMVKGASRGNADTQEMKDSRVDFFKLFCDVQVDKGRFYLCSDREEARKQNANLSRKYLCLDLFGNEREVTLNLSRVDRNKK